MFNHYLDYHFPPGWKVFTDITNHLPHMKKLKLMSHMRTGGLQSFEVTVRSCRRMHFFMTRETVSR